MTTSKVDLLYLAFNRFEFTRESFSCLLENTDWSCVNQLHVYDDGSTDGTAEWLSEAVSSAPVPVDSRHTRAGSPVTLFVEFIQRATAPILAKCDSDAVFPPGWLRDSLSVMDRHPDLDLLGIEAMHPLPESPGPVYGYADAMFMSGLGLYRRRAFDRSQPQAVDRYFGLEEWQMEQGTLLKRGWIKPALAVFLLDRMPTEPWRSLSTQYVANGWQRPWPYYYDSSSPLWRWRWPDGPTTARPPDHRPSSKAVESEESATSIPTKRLNLACLEPPLVGYLNAGPFHTPGVDVVDLDETWPWPDATFEHVRCIDILNRLADKVRAMNELWRITKPSGTVELSVPSTDGVGAFQDPTYRSFWNERSFAYFEAGNPIRERLSGRYGINAAWRILEQRTDLTDDGPRLVLRLEARGSDMPHSEEAGPAKAHSPDRVRSKTNGAEIGVASLASSGAPHRSAPTLLGALRIKNEAAHIREVLERALVVCDRVLVFDDNSDDQTVEICRSFGTRVSVILSPFQGLDEARDKNYLLARVIAEDLEWALWIDGDEVLEKAAAERIPEAMSDATGVAAFSLRIAYVWDDPAQVRTDGLWGRFTRPSVFRLRGQPVEALTFAASGFGGNFHCGNVPNGLVGETRQLDVRLKHYGYQTRSQRMAKYDFYTTHDPNNELEDNYRHLAEIPGARHAPGPPQIEPWQE